MTTPADAHPGAIEAVLFDMDGTLSDTEAFWHEAEQFIATQYGTGPVTNRAEQRAGASMHAGAVFLQEQYGVSLTIPQIQRLTIDHVLASIEQGFTWQPGARELLAETKALDIPTALVTTSPRAVARRIVGALPVGSFDVIITDEDVTRSKPDPEPYLTAANRLNADPRWAIAIEDSRNGTLSAQSAGCLVVAVSPHTEIDEAPRRIILTSLCGTSVQLLQPSDFP